VISERLIRSCTAFRGFTSTHATTCDYLPTTRPDCWNKEHVSCSS